MKKINDTNDITVVKSIKTVIAGFILIFLKENVGSLLINRIETMSVKYGVIEIKEKLRSNSARL